MPSCPSSQVVSRDPCSSGRVSSAMTWARAPRSRSGIAVRVHLQRARPALLDQERGAPLAQPLADLVRGVADGEGGGLHRACAVGQQRRHGEDLAAQVDRGRPGVGDPLDLGVEPGGVPPLALGLAGRERHAERAGHPEQWRAPHDQPDNRVDKLIHGGEVENGDLMRESGLVNGDNVAVPPADNVI
jgi:hypothetical protein